MSLPQLPLANIAARHGGLTPAVADNYLEAASVCLSRHHTPPCEFSLRVDRANAKTLVNWTRPDERVRHAWANESDATRDGAYICALTAVELTKGLVAVRRAETLTGADYYVGPADSPTSDLENCWRLEVSGTDKGNDAVIKRRLKEKLAQAAAGQSNLPARAFAKSQEKEAQWSK